jgi:hypothetical protein
MNPKHSTQLLHLRTANRVAADRTERTSVSVQLLFLHILINLYVWKQWLKPRASTTAQLIKGANIHSQNDNRTYMQYTCIKMFLLPLESNRKIL